MVDDRLVTQSAIEQAIEMAQIHRSNIVFFCVLPHFDYLAADMLPAADVSAEAAEEASRLLASASAWAERCGVHSHSATSTSPDAAHAVADAAVKRHCDLIVVGTEEHNAVVHLLSGSIVPGLISKATVPVLVCRDRPLCARRNSHLRCPFQSRPPVRELGTRDADEQND